MPFFGTGGNRSNNSTSEGGKSEVHISISTDAQASAKHSNRGGHGAGLSAEEQRKLKLENDALELKLAQDRRRGDPGLHSEAWS